MKIEFIPALPLSHPPVPGLHPPDEPGAFLFQDVALLNQTREPVTDNPVSVYVVLGKPGTSFALGNSVRER